MLVQRRKEGRYRFHGRGQWGGKVGGFQTFFLVSSLVFTCLLSSSWLLFSAWF